MSEKPSCAPEASGRATTVILAVAMLTGFGLAVTGLAPPASAGGHCDAMVGPGESIQAAIDGASPSDTICVQTGVYEEAPTVHENANGVTLDGLTLSALEPHRPVVDATGVAATAVDVRAEDVTLEGFTIRNLDTSDEGRVIGVDVAQDARGAQIVGNQILVPAGWIAAQGSGPDFGTPHSGGVVLKADPTVVQDNVIAAEPASASLADEELRVLGTWGIFLESPGDGEIVGNEASGFLLGVRVESGGVAPVIEGNLIAGNNHGLQVPSADATIVDNDFEANHRALSFTGLEPAEVTGNDLAGNARAVHLWDSVNGGTLDLSENYWGVAGCAVIEETRIDNRGNPDDIVIAPYHADPAGEVLVTNYLDPTCG